MRKDKNAFDTYSSFENISNFKIDGNYPMHSTKKKGINCSDIDETDNYIVTGGVDGVINIFNKAQ